MIQCKGIERIPYPAVSRVTDSRPALWCPAAQIAIVRALSCAKTHLSPCPKPIPER